MVIADSEWNFDSAGVTGDGIEDSGAEGDVIVRSLRGELDCGTIDGGRRVEGRGYGL
jgi:hypothetical protein